MLLSIYIPDIVCCMFHHAQLRQCDKKTRASHIESLMKDVGLTPFKDTKVSKLSNGFKRRVSVLVAFVGEPKVNTIQHTCIATTSWPVWLMLVFLFFVDGQRSN